MCIYSVETVCIFGKLETVVWFLQRSVGGTVKELAFVLFFYPTNSDSFNLWFSVCVIGRFILLCSFMKSEKGHKRARPVGKHNMID